MNFIHDYKQMILYHPYYIQELGHQLSIETALVDNSVITVMAFLAESGEIQ